MDNTDRIAKIERLITDAFAPTKMEVIDDSHLHAGHAGAKGGAGHFTLKVCTDEFIGKTLVERHRMIYKVLERMFPADIHALSIQAITTKEKESR